MNRVAVPAASFVMNKFLSFVSLVTFPSSQRFYHFVSMTRPIQFLDKINDDPHTHFDIIDIKSKSSPWPWLTSSNGSFSRALLHHHRISSEAKHASSSSPLLTKYLYTQFVHETTKTTMK